ncbi:MAG: hypothetical protein J0L51_14410 [Rhizobiales bacterium]|nr:hypothetical protein [Hyphomicrobiales bacterium]
MLIISFDNVELKQSCCDNAVAEAAYGTINARALFTAIADAEAMENAAELIDFYGNEVVVQQDSSLMLSFGSDLIAKLIPVGKKFKRADDGSVNWQTVRHLKLVQIGNRH